MSSVLFDTPGPRGVARNRLFGLLGALVVGGALAYVIYRLSATGQFDGQKWSWLEYRQVQEDLLNAVLAILQAFALGAVFALVFGAAFAAARLSDHAWLHAPATAIVEFFRAVPLLVLIFIFYYGLPSVDLKVSPLFALVFGLTLYNGSVLAEIFRAGVLSLPTGQREAAYGLGMRKTQVMNNVLLPQAVRVMLPTIISQLVVLLKDTALGFLITYPELLKYAQNLGGQIQFGRPLIPVFIVAAVIYICLCLLLSMLARYLEARSRRSRRRPDVDPAATAGADHAVLSAT